MNVESKLRVAPAVFGKLGSTPDWLDAVTRVLMGFSLFWEIKYVYGFTPQIIARMGDQRQRASWPALIGAAQVELYTDTSAQFRDSSAISKRYRRITRHW